MRTPRDILVAGTGFLLGMLFCYFMIAPKPAPEVNKTAMNQAQTLPIFRTAAMPPVPQTGNVEQVIWTRTRSRSISDLNRWLEPNGMRPRIVPVRDLDGQTFDLIDLNYVPDFKIDLE